MLKETETKKHRLFVTFLSLMSFQLGEGGGLLPSLAKPMSERGALALCQTINPALVIALRS